MCFIIFVLLFHSSRGEIFTSIAHVQSLLDTQKQLPNIIEKYIEMERERLDEIRRIAVEKTEEIKSKFSHSSNIIGNPVSAFHFIQQLHQNWNEILELLKNNTAKSFLYSYQTSGRLMNPSEEDLSGAALALLRLQDTYRLSTKDMSNGRILNSKPTNGFSARDCYNIGRAAYTANDFYHTVLWMQEALDRLKTEKIPTVSLEDVLEHLSFSLFKQGNIKRALQITDRLYEMMPDHPRAKSNIKWYEDLLEEEGVKKSEFRRDIPRLQNHRPLTATESEKERDVYEALCRNEIPVSVKETSKLYCYYKMDRPYLRLAPFKVEILRFNPLAVLFHDVISDDEVETIQLISTPQLRRATVQNSVTGELETAAYRISKSAWLRGQENEVVDCINKRVGMMTNLEQSTAEELQIANYGLGGHYDPHFDFARKDEEKSFESLGTGNRIATMLFYMTQPEIGGATVFTELRTTVLPSKNDALFWYNLMRSGEGDLTTRHAACPVLIGVKWVANKWIHELGQEFKRPCGIHRYDSEKFVGDLGGPEPRHHANIYQ